MTATAEITQTLAAGVVNEVDAAIVHGWLQAEEIVLVDVRETAEYEQEHIPGAVLCPLSMFEPALFPTFPDKQLVLHCAVGKRSAAAAKQLLDAGHRIVTNMQGGLQAWKQSGLPTELSSGAAVDTGDLPYLALTGEEAQAPAPHEKPGVHPGRILENEFLGPLGITQAALSEATGISASTVSDIVGGKSAVSAETAIRLARYLCTTEEFWMRLQATHDLAVARQAIGAEVDRSVNPRRGSPCSPF